ncbi:MAG: complement resistance protein TraT [Gammaproteobacteria bacterium]|nr:complement resistance protein TraT [Gammaproteobacteria bacterium]
MNHSKKTLWAASIVAMATLTGCAALSTSISNRNLNVQTKMSKTIFLNPIADNQKLIYLQIKNTSDQQTLSIEPQIIADLQAKGYQISTDPAKAFEMLQINILQAGATTNANLQRSLVNGAGTGVLTGMAVGGLSHSSEAGILAGAAIGIGSIVADSFVKNVTYAVTTDIQITINSNSAKKQQYQTRIVSYANKVNLKFAEAEPQLSAALARSIANIF